MREVSLEQQSSRNVQYALESENKLHCTSAYLKVSILYAVYSMAKWTICVTVAVIQCFWPDNRD